MSLPQPEPGLVIRYSYLWAHEHRAGREEGVKDRPCTIILAIRSEGEDVHVVVVPVTHRAPQDKTTAVELPISVKRHLQLDEERAWVILSESNVFRWPGPDLRRIGDRNDSSIAYGYLPPKLFAELRRRFVAFETAARSKRVTRTE